MAIMVRQPKPIRDKTLKKWLTDFKNKSTRANYCSALRAFKKNLNITDLGEYLESEPEPTEDIKKFLSSLDGRPPKTQKGYAGAVKVFFQDNGIPIKDSKWRKLRRRGFLPKRAIAQTRDKCPSKTQLKKILNYLDIKGRALVLFLVSSGARIGETLQLNIDDFELDAEPPRVHINGDITKDGVGQRTVYFSYEARDAILDWLNIKNRMGKRDGTTYKGEKVFAFSGSTALSMWNRACDKAGLDIKDKRTKRRIYHIHSLRKLFRTKIGLELDMTHALMGHTKYLDESYLRQEQGEIAQAYLEAMSNVSVYQVEEIALRKAVEPIHEELEALKKKYARLESMYEAAATLYKQLDRKELEKTITEIYQKVKTEA